MDVLKLFPSTETMDVLKLFPSTETMEIMARLKRVLNGTRLKLWTGLDWKERGILAVD